MRIITIRIQVFLFVLLSHLNIYSQISFSEYNITSAGSRFITVDIGDVNNDCLNDLVAGNEYDHDTSKSFKIFIFIQDSIGKLNAPISFTYSHSHSINNVKIVDMNNDLLNDIVVCARDTLKIFYQQTDHNFSKEETFYSGTMINDLDAGDLNNDGLTDLALVHQYDSYIKIFYQNKDHVFTMQKINDVETSSDTQVLLKDINNDGLIDILKTNIVNIHIFYQSCLSKKVDTIPYIYLNQAFDSFYHTLNGIDIGNVGSSDGKSSLIIGLSDLSTSVVIVDQDNNNHLLPYGTTTINGIDLPQQIKVADLDNDGKNEIIIGWGGGWFIGIYERTSNGSYSFKNINCPNVDCSFNFTAMAIGDLNNDGLQDIVYANDFVGIYLNTSANKSTLNSIRSIANFYPCQQLTSERVTDTEIVLTTVTGMEKNCAFIKTYKSTVNSKYVVQKGIGDSIIINSSCPRIIDTIKRNQIVYNKIFHGKDTLELNNLVNVQYSFSNPSSISGPNTICASNDPVIYQSVNNLTASNTWYYLNDSLKSQLAQIVLSVPGNQMLSVKENIPMSSGSCINFDTVYIQVVPNLLVQNSIFGKDTVCEEEANIIYTTLENENSIYTWSVSGASISNNELNAISVSFPLDGNAIISVREIDKNNCIGPVSTKEIYIKKINDCLKPPNVFTPNEDGINDAFEIKNIILYPYNKLSVFNRWGSKVFESENYKGDWKAENIPDGLYYYSFKVNQKPENQGWIQILR